MGADAILAVVLDGAQSEAGFAIARAALDAGELLLGASRIRHEDEETVRHFDGHTVTLLPDRRTHSFFGKRFRQNAKRRGKKCMIVAVAETRD
ncbi:hypothetical protein [Mycobacterium sp. 1245852.3]|uniref:hypothetical protein n=1 Tax=Mycobacterium sp. 1245852.3 TaxID=1856860 RepID=UPI0012E9D288|nr:hypothetical protein [Mycobacterium sp. 1245852.3]